MAKWRASSGSEACRHCSRLCRNNLHSMISWWAGLKRICQWHRLGFDASVQSYWFGSVWGTYRRYQGRSSWYCSTVEGRGSRSFAFLRLHLRLSDHSKECPCTSVALCPWCCQEWRARVAKSCRCPQAWRSSCQYLHGHKVCDSVSTYQLWWHLKASIQTSRSSFRRHSLDHQYFHWISERTPDQILGIYSRSDPHDCLVEGKSIEGISIWVQGEGKWPQDFNRRDRRNFPRKRSQNCKYRLFPMVPAKYQRNASSYCNLHASYQISW